MEAGYFGEVERTFTERWFTRPWQPFKRTRMIFIPYEKIITTQNIRRANERMMARTPVPQPLVQHYVDNESDQANLLTTLAMLHASQQPNSITVDEPVFATASGGGDFGGGGATGSWEPPEPMPPAPAPSDWSCPAPEPERYSAPAPEPYCAPPPPYESPAPSPSYSSSDYSSSSSSDSSSSSSSSYD